MMKGKAQGLINNETGCFFNLEKEVDWLHLTVAFKCLFECEYQVCNMRQSLQEMNCNDCLQFILEKQKETEKVEKANISTTL